MHLDDHAHRTQRIAWLILWSRLTAAPRHVHVWTLHMMLMVGSWFFAHIPRIETRTLQRSCNPFITFSCVLVEYIYQRYTYRVYGMEEGDLQHKTRFVAHLKIKVLFFGFSLFQFLNTDVADHSAPAIFWYELIKTFQCKRCTNRSRTKLFRTLTYHLLHVIGYVYLVCEYTHLYEWWRRSYVTGRRAQQFVGRCDRDKSVGRWARYGSYCL